MSIELVRIDDRLIHGQVVMAWHKFCPVDRMVVVDDKVANDAIRKMLLETVAPPGVAVSVFGLKQGAESLQKETFLEERLMLLVTNPLTLVNLAEAGVSFEKVNVGGMGLGAGKKELTAAVALDESEKDAFLELIRRGIKIAIQVIPSDAPLEMKELLAEKY